MKISVVRHRPSLRPLMITALLLLSVQNTVAAPRTSIMKQERSKFIPNREVIERKILLVLDFANVKATPQWLSLERKIATKTSPGKLLLVINAAFPDDITANKLSKIVTVKELESAGIEKFTVKNSSSGLSLVINATSNAIPSKVSPEELKTAAQTFLLGYQTKVSLTDGSAENLTSLLERRLLSRTYSQETFSTRVNRLAIICLGAKNFNALNREPEILKSILVSLGVDMEPKQPPNSVSTPSIRKLSSTEPERSMTPSPISPNFSTFPGPQASFSSGGGGAVVPPIVSGQSQKKSTSVSIPQPRSVHWTPFDLNAVTPMVTPSIPKSVPSTEENAERRVQYPKELDEISRKLALQEYMEHLERRIRNTCKQLSERPPAGYSARISFKLDRLGTMFYIKNTDSKFSFNDWGLKVIFEASPFRSLPEGAPETVEFICQFRGDQPVISMPGNKIDMANVPNTNTGIPTNSEKINSGNGEFLPYIGNLHTPAPSRPATVQVKFLTVDNFMKKIQDLITENCDKFRAIDIPDDASFAIARFDINRARVISNIRISKSSGDLTFDERFKNCIKTISVPFFPTNSPDVLKIEFKFGDRKIKGDLKEVEQKPLPNSSDGNATSIELRRYSLAIVEKLYPWILLFLEDAGQSSSANISFAIRNGQIGSFKITEIVPNDTADKTVSYYLQHGIEEYWPMDYFAVRKLNAVGSIKLSRATDDAFAEVKLSNANHVLSSHKYFVGKIKASTD